MGTGLAAFVLLVLLWEGHKLVGLPGRHLVHEVRLLPRADNASMPHV